MQRAHHPIRTVAFTIFAVNRRFTRLALMWLLAVVVPLQGMAVGIFTALGPSHIHKAAKSVLVLEDVRRWKPSPVRESKVRTLWGHSHESASTQRHYHRFDEVSVVNQGIDVSANGSSVDDGLSTGSFLASFWVLKSEAAAWQPLQASNVLASRPSWTSMSVVVEPHDRPPKSAA